MALGGRAASTGGRERVISETEYHSDRRLKAGGRMKNAAMCSMTVIERLRQQVKSGPTCARVSVARAVFGPRTA
jgi:hypothetical protein